MKKYAILVVALAFAAGCQTDYSNSGRSASDVQSGMETGIGVPVQDRDIHVPPHGGEQLNRINVSPDRGSVTPNQGLRYDRRSDQSITGDHHESSSAVQNNEGVGRTPSSSDNLQSSDQPSANRNGTFDRAPENNSNLNRQP